MSVYVYSPILAASALGGGDPPDPPSTEGRLVFDLCPEEIEIRYRRRGEKSPASGGFVQRRTYWTGFDLRIFSLSWINATDAEASRMRDIWRRAYGPVKKMLWTPPGSASSTFVKLVGSRLNLRPRTAVAWSAEIVLEEVR